MYDLVIIGAGPAGLAASIYASRYQLKHLVLGAEVGGTISWAHKVDNYPGLPGLTGVDLAKRFVDHAKGLGATIVAAQVVDLQRKGEVFSVVSSDGKRYEAKALILATGTRRKELGVPGEKEFLGKGVSYCPTCDAPFYKGKRVVVVGGADAACSGAIHLAKFADKVYLLYRKGKLRATPAWIKGIEKEKKIKVLYGTNIVKIVGEGERVAGVELDEPVEGGKLLAAEGVFIEIGGVPLTDLAGKIGVRVDKENYIPTDDGMSSNVKGVYCVGDVGSHWKECQQVVTAVAEGAVAVCGVYRLLYSNAKG